MSVPFHLNLAEGWFGSIRLMFVSWWFKIGGIIFALITLSGIAAFVVGTSISDGPRPQTAALFIVAGMTIALYATGRMLAHHDRRGAVLGLVLTLYPFVFAPFTNAPMDSIDIAVSAVTVILLLSVWPELTWRRSRAGG
jgi:signal transduction histidine kinase